MKITGFQIQMYKSILNSGWINVEHLTVLMGKNESGKTSLLKALHKLNPFIPEPYNMAREWPRGHREKRSEQQVVCTARFSLDPEELAELKEIAGKDFPSTDLDVSRNYKGELTVHFPEDFFPVVCVPMRLIKHVQCFRRFRTTLAHRSTHRQQNCRTS